MDSASETARSQTPSDDELLGRFADELAKERAHWSGLLTGDDNAMEPFAKRELERLSTETPHTRLERHRRNEEQKAKYREIAEQQAKDDMLRKKQAIWGNFIKQRGQRYVPCRLSNYEAAFPKQVEALAAMQGYADAAWERIGDGQNVVIFGPSGTGKDHLLVGLVHATIAGLEQAKAETRNREVTFEWHNGPALSAAVRADIASGCRERDTTIYSACNAAVLLLSDIIPPAGKLTDFQADTLYLIIDERYNWRRPTWVSVNVKNRQELDAGLGAAVADRLIDGALTIGCDWPSYRKRG